MRVGVLGSGDVAKTLGAGFLKHGHDVMMGTRSPGKLADRAAQNPGDYSAVRLTWSIRCFHGSGWLSPTLT